MKNVILFFFAFIFLIACSKEVEPEKAEAQIVQHDKGDIDAFINKSIQSGQIFDWSTASLPILHSAVLLSDSIVAIGYQIENVENISESIGISDRLEDRWLEVRDDILNLVLDGERRVRGSDQLELKDLLPFELDDVIPTLAVQITNIETLEMLKNRGDIRYVEPMGYELKREDLLKSSSGCDGSPDYGINSADYTNTNSYNAKIPWNFYNHNIPSAWNISTGDNIGICIIDSGASDSQDNLGSQFSSGNSPSRTIRKYSTHYSGSWWWKSLDSPHDQCGHGTSMAGLAGAPWSTDGNAVGVAYRSNLITVRAVADVIISSSNEKNGVKNALKLAGNRSDVKIVSMSIGNVISSGTVKDGIYYAYNRGKLLLAAAGTSTTFTNWAGVIFPASMNETVAVTGVKAQGSYSRCNTCHSGSKVDFTIQMQRSYDSGRNSLGLATYSNQPKYISGSSCATATTAGIAALVWATNPGMSRSTVINRLKVASDLYPNRSSNYGWGNINAEAAVLGTSY